MHAIRERLRIAGLHRNVTDDSWTCFASALKCRLFVRTVVTLLETAATEKVHRDGQGQVDTNQVLRIFVSQLLSYEGAPVATLRRKLRVAQNIAHQGDP